MALLAHGGERRCVLAGKFQTHAGPAISRARPSSYLRLVRLIKDFSVLLFSVPTFLPDGKLLPSMLFIEVAGKDNEANCVVEYSSL